MPHAIVAYPELNKTDSDWIQEIRKRHDQPHYSLVNPHFTFVFPTDEIEEGRLIAHVESALAGEAAFEVVMRRAVLGDDAFSDVSYVFLVPDRGHAEIIKLHDKLYSGPLVKELRTDIPYVPHLTVGNSRDVGECRKLAGRLNAAGFEIAARISRVDVIRINQRSVTSIAFVDFKKFSGRDFGVKNRD